MCKTRLVVSNLKPMLTLENIKYLLFSQLCYLLKPPKNSIQSQTSVQSAWYLLHSQTDSIRVCRSRNVYVQMAYNHSFFGKYQNSRIFKKKLAISDQFLENNEIGAKIKTTTRYDKFIWNNVVAGWFTTNPVALIYLVLEMQILK